MDYLGSSKHIIMSFANRDYLTSSFLTWIPLIFFFCLMFIARTTKTMLRIEIIDILSLCLNSVGNTQFHTSNSKMAMRFIIDRCYYFEKSSFHPIFLRVLILNGSCKVFYASINMIIYILLLLMWYVMLIFVFLCFLGAYFVLLIFMSTFYNYYFLITIFYNLLSSWECLLFLLLFFQMLMSGLIKLIFQMCSKFILPRPTNHQ